MFSQQTRSKIIRIPGKSFSVTDGVHLCRNFGKEYKLIELHINEYMTNFISQTSGGRFKTPAGIYYESRQHNFVYLSSDLPVTSKSANFRFENGESIESYKYWESYSDYFGHMLSITLKFI